MNLGLIGLGRQGRRYLEPKNAGDSIRFVMQRGDDFGAFLTNLDGVIIATPAETHAELAIRCLRAGKPVLVEKPLATTWRDCAEVIDLAQERGLPLLVGHTHLFSEAFTGWPVDTTEVYATFSGTCGESSWIDWGPHVVAMALHVLGEFDGPVVVEEKLNGVSAFLESTNASLRVERSAERKRVFKVVDSNTDWWLYNADAPCEHTALWHQVETFKRMIRGETDRRGSYEFARRVYRTLFGELS